MNTNLSTILAIVLIVTVATVFAARRVRTVLAESRRREQMREAALLAEVMNTASPVDGSRPSGERSLVATVADPEPTVEPSEPVESPAGESVSGASGDDELTEDAPQGEAHEEAEAVSVEDEMRAFFGDATPTPSVEQEPNPEA